MDEEAGCQKRYASHSFGCASANYGIQNQHPGGTAFELTFTDKNGQSASALVRWLDRDPRQPSEVVYGKAYSYCKYLFHSASRCPDSPDRS